MQCCSEIVPVLKTTSPNAVTIDEGNPLELTAEFENVSAAVWYLNGEKVNEPFEVQQDENKFSLFIAKMDAPYAGEYMLEVTSSTGHVFKQTFNVEYKGIFIFGDVLFLHFTFFFD